MELATTDDYTIERGTGAGIITLVWKDHTDEMSEVDYRDALSRFGSILVEYRGSAAMVDVSELRHTPNEMTEEWYQQNVAPKLNQAGINKLAYIWGPDREVPPNPDYPGPGENYTTHHFADREDARDWLLGY